jgi:hypothetical protein
MIEPDCLNEYAYSIYLLQLLSRLQVADLSLPS